MTNSTLADIESRITALRKDHAAAIERREKARDEANDIYAKIMEAQREQTRELTRQLRAELRGAGRKP